MNPLGFSGHQVALCWRFPTESKLNMKKQHLVSFAPQSCNKPPQNSRLALTLTTFKCRLKTVKKQKQMCFLICFEMISVFLICILMLYAAFLDFTYAKHFDAPLCMKCAAQITLLQSWSWDNGSKANKITFMAALTTHGYSSDMLYKINTEKGNRKKHVRGTWDRKTALAYFLPH